MFNVQHTEPISIIATQVLPRGSHTHSTQKASIFYIRDQPACIRGFPGGSDGKESAYNVGDPGSICWSVTGRSWLLFSYSPFGTLRCPGKKVQI